MKNNLKMISKKTDTVERELTLEELTDILMDALSNLEGTLDDYIELYTTLKKK